MSIFDQYLTYLFPIACSFREKFPDIKRYKFSGIDPLRAKQACENVASNFEAMVNSTLKEAYLAKQIPSFKDGNLGPFYDSENPSASHCPTLKDLPAYLKYNYDEMGTNGDEKRPGKLGSKKKNPQVWEGLYTKMHAGKETFNRLFEVTLSETGDGVGHRTIGVTSRADGKFRLCDEFGNVLVEGAPPPIAIHATNGSESNRHRLSKAMRAGFPEADNTHLKSGIKVISHDLANRERQLFTSQRAL